MMKKPLSCFLCPCHKEKSKKDGTTFISCPVMANLITYKKHAFSADKFNRKDISAMHNACGLDWENSL